MDESTEAWRWAVAQYLRSLRGAGVGVLPRAELSPEDLAALAPSSTASAPVAPVVPNSSAALMEGPGKSVSAGPTSQPPGPVRRPSSMPQSAALQSGPQVTSPVGNARSYPPSQSVDVRLASLSIIEAEVRDCQRCPALAPKRNQTVFGEGSVNPRVLFFGEAPGEEEDKQGRPFVGAAGQLLTKMIEACGFQRSDVYILNSLKCRPPGNRPPADSELLNCCEYWQRQIDILQPEYIVCLGAYAIRSVIGPGQSISKLRGRFYSYGTSKVVATYHPSYLLRTASAKKLAWEDLKMMLADMQRDSGN